MIQIDSDGETVWVNDPTGCCIGRYKNGMMDVHKTGAEQMRTGTQCLDCGHGAENTWESFKASMLEHHGVIIPDRHQPKTNNVR